MSKQRGTAPLPRLEFPDGELDAWAALGDVTERSVRVWVRSPSGRVGAALIVDGVECAAVEIRTAAQHDYVGAGVLEIGRARPGSEFEVRVGDAIRRGRFAPEPGSRAQFTFAFGSCHQPFVDERGGGRLDKHPAARIYSHIRALLAERSAAFAMWLGDQVYSDSMSDASVRDAFAQNDSVTDESLVETYRHLYRGFFNESGFRELAEAVPAYLMWDDHDIFDGWGSLIERTSSDERVYSAAELAFREYQHLRNPQGAVDSPPPFGYSFWRGDVGFHVPDLRSERDFEKRRVMGANGWARLDTFLEEASARGVPTVFLGISVPVVHASPVLMAALERLKTSSGRDVRDRWSIPTFAAERTKLVDRLFAWQSGAPHRQVIILSGDVHVGAAFDVRQRSGPGRFSQWTSSALSTPDGLKHVLANRLITKFVRAGERELRVWRRGLATSNNVGVVDVLPAEGGGHVVRLAIYEYDADTDQLTRALEDVSSPGGR